MIAEDARYQIEQDEILGWNVLDTHDPDDPFLFNFDSRSEALCCAISRNLDEEDANDQ